ncbi:MAG: phosphodiester glycosidase family protein [Candidatus Tumulicola sp.]
MKSVAFAVAAFVLVPVAATAGGLPARLFPAEPFPRILQQAPTVETVAPGVTFGEYALHTAIGPLVVRVVAVDPHRGDVRVGEVLAHDALESPGETVGSMAKRTGAVAGINGDYYDIGNTNRPSNIVVRNGVLLQMPRNRYALAITREGVPDIAEFGFIGQIQIGERTTSLDAIDESAPNGGTSLLTPAFGSVPPQENVTLVAMQPLSGTPPLTRYRVTAVVDNLTTQPPGYYVAIGPGAYNSVDVPSGGDLVTASGDLSPIGLDSIATAIGGGPLILHGGEWTDDPNGPNGGEYEKRIPCSGAGIARDGELFLIEVDGRQPSVSVGLTRREFAALMRAVGADEAMAFDGGGSSTLAVRRIGDAASHIVNSPSDRIERPVGNGLFVYSTAPVGPATRLVAQPGVIRAVSGAEVPFRIAAVDAADHLAASGSASAVVEPGSLGRFRNGTFYAQQSGTGHILLRSGPLKGAIAVEVSTTPATISIEPPQANVDNNGTLPLNARPLDAHGYALAVPPILSWRATAGSIDGFGRYHAGSHDADVAVRIGDASASARVTVGSHQVGLPFADRARFTTVPGGGSGNLTRDPRCRSCVTLTYAFGDKERAAYARSDLPLPAGTIGLSFDVLDDGSASRLRVALRNAINEDVRTDATLLDDPGWRHVVLRFPTGSGDATRLMAIYVLPPKGMQLSSGQIVLRNVRAVVAGNQ